MALPDVEEPPTWFEWLTSDNGTSINFGRLVTVISGILAGSFFGGWAAAIVAFFDSWLISPLLDLGTWLNLRITLFSEGLASIGETSWLQSTGFAVGLGILAPVFAFGLYLAMSYVVAKIREEVIG